MIATFSKASSKEGDGTLFTVYVAGRLFKDTEPIGNTILPRLIQRIANGTYLCNLPQGTVNRQTAARNIDLLGVIGSDMAVFIFDGSDVDSSMIAEMMFAKMLDIPAVILRFDSKSGGEQFSLIWCSYPRKKVVTVNGLAWYQEALDAGGGAADIEERYCTRIATAVVEGLDCVRSERPFLSMHQIYRLALRFEGAGLERAPSLMRSVIQRKIAKGLLPPVSSELSPHTAEQLFTNFFNLQQLSKDISRSCRNATKHLLSSATIEKCHQLIDEVLELDRFYSDCLEDQLFFPEFNGTEMRQAMSTSIRARCAEIQAREEALYQAVPYDKCECSVCQQTQVLVRQSLWKLIQDVRQVAATIQQKAEAPSKSTAPGT